MTVLREGRERELSRKVMIPFSMLTACGSIDIRNTVQGFEQLENCTVIEGKLHILLIDHAEQKDYEKFRFPLLREITGHLLLYRVYGLKTLRHIFPNLAVIRGQDLFYNYALVAYEMPDLEEIGLVSLTTIMRGAVRLTKNNRLCYVDTIDWSRIAVGLKESDHHIQENKDETECANYCPEECSMTTVDGKEAKRCWTGQHCQKNLGEYCAFHFQFPLRMSEQCLRTSIHALSHLWGVSARLSWKGQQCWCGWTRIVPNHRRWTVCCHLLPLFFPSGDQWCDGLVCVCS